MLNNLQIFTWSTCIFPGSIQIPTSLFQGLALRLVGIILYNEMEQWSSWSSSLWLSIIIIMFQGLVLCLVGVAVGQFSEALLETSTPVPILRFLPFFSITTIIPTFIITTCALKEFDRFSEGWQIFKYFVNILVIVMLVLFGRFITSLIFSSFQGHHVIIFPGTLTVRMRTVLTLTDLRYF